MSAALSEQLRHGSRCHPEGKTVLMSPTAVADCQGTRPRVLYPINGPIHAHKNEKTMRHRMLNHLLMPMVVW